MTLVSIAVDAPEIRDMVDLTLAQFPYVARWTNEKGVQQSARFPTFTAAHRFASGLSAGAAIYVLHPNGTESRCRPFGEQALPAHLRERTKR